MGNVPLRGLHWNGSDVADQLGDYVLTVNERNIVTRRKVTLAQTTPATATIASGITPGDRVIIDGIEKVHPGLTVQPDVVTSPIAQG